MYYKPEYDGDTPIEQPYYYNYYEILDMLSIKLLVFGYAEKEIKYRRELQQNDKDKKDEEGL